MGTSLMQIKLDYLLIRGVLYNLEKSSIEWLLLEKGNYTITAKLKSNIKFSITSK